MADLSPQAQAVWEAFNEDESGTFVDYGDKLAAALRALADLVVPANFQVTVVGRVQQRTRTEILAIAAELEGNSEPTFTPKEVEMIQAPWSYLQSQQKLEGVASD